jgi:hypothetical protein
VLHKEHIPEYRINKENTRQRRDAGKSVITRKPARRKHRAF